MPDLVISLTASQAQRLGVALGAANLAEATTAVKAILKARVKEYEARHDGDTASEAARIKVDTDFSGF